jgi:hypothetical protein
MHESMHIFCKSFTLIKEQIVEYLMNETGLSRNICFSVVNVVEDARINYIGKILYRGFYSLLKEDHIKIMNEKYWNIIIDKSNKTSFTFSNLSIDEKLELYVNGTIAILNNLYNRNSSVYSLLFTFDTDYFNEIIKIMNELKEILPLLHVKDFCLTILKLLLDRIDLIGKQTNINIKDSSGIEFDTKDEKSKRDMDTLTSINDNKKSINTTKKNTENNKNNIENNKKENENLEKLIKELEKKLKELEKSQSSNQQNENKSDNLGGFKEDIINEIEELFEIEENEIKSNEINYIKEEIRKNNHKIQSNKNNNKLSKQNNITNENTIKRLEETLKKLLKSLEENKTLDQKEIKEMVKKKLEEEENEYTKKETPKVNFNIKTENCNDVLHPNLDKFDNPTDVIRENDNIIREIESIMQKIKNKSKYKSGYDSGYKINVRRYIRSKSITNSKADFFSRKYESDKIFITVIIDLSDSMDKKVSGINKLECARDSVFTFVEGFKDIAKIRLVGFSGVDTDAMISVFKDFEEGIDYDKLDKIRCMANYLQTPDGMVILKEAELLRNKQGKKLIIVISDGRPYMNGRHGRVYNVTKAEIDLEKARNLVPIFAFSLEADGEHLKRMYGDNYINCSVFNFKKNMIDLTNLILSEMTRR